MNRTKNIAFVSFVMGAVLFVASCKKDPSLIAPKTQTIQLESLVPSYFPNAIYRNSNNPFTKEKIALGRKLFYDPMLSGSNTMSCASCHTQGLAFSDAGVKISPGENGSVGNRNSPPIFNIAWNKTYMWDGGITNLEIMPFAPITASHEMNQNMKELLEELKLSNSYPQEFDAAFGKEGLSEVNFYYALSQFMSVMISADSKYDHVRLGTATFSAEESKGYSLFLSHCNNCHTEPLFTNQGYENNGLAINYADSGRGRVTNLTEDMAKFKIPSLRNIERTYPYMHDGRIQNLNDVLNHYSNQIKPHPNLHSSLQGGLKLTKAEEESIIAFLRTLTDHTFLNNPNLSNPF